MDTEKTEDRITKQKIEFRSKNSDFLVEAVKHKGKGKTFYRINKTSSNSL
jgi:hypothetical protein